VKGQLEGLMNWDALGAMGEIVGAIAVVATLPPFSPLYPFTSQSIGNQKVVRIQVESYEY
jgi:hypothetical protein